MKKTYTIGFTASHEVDAKDHLRVLRGRGIEGCLEPCDDPETPFACIFKNVDKHTCDEIETYFRNWFHDNGLIPE